MSSSLLKATPHTRQLPSRSGVASAAIDVVAKRFGRLAYSRVDLVRADDGTSQVLEVELVEPSPFLPYEPEAVRGSRPCWSARAAAARQVGRRSTMDACVLHVSPAGSTKRAKRSLSGASRTSTRHPRGCVEESRGWVASGND